MVRIGMGTAARVAAALAALVLGLSFPGSATATPVVGQQLYYEGGSLTVTVLPYNATFTSNFYLFSTGGPLFIANSSQVGTVVDLGNLEALYGIQPGDELIFGILVLDTGHTFVMGPGARNLDGVAHAASYYEEGSTSDLVTLGFEDLFGGGDLDYNDALFLVEGGIGFVDRVPAPASLMLLVLGLTGAAFAVHSRSAIRHREATGNPLK